MTASRSLATRVRWAMLVAALLCWAAGLFWVFGVYLGPIGGFGIMGIFGTPVAPLGADEWYLPISFAYVGLFLVTQWFLFGPRGAWSITLTDRGRPMTLSIIVAALAAMMLSMGWVALVAHLTDRWPNPDSPTTTDPWRWVWCVMAVVWCVWGIVFYLYWRRGDRYTQFTRLIRGLIAGSVLELIVAAPIHATSGPHRHDCYCAPASYTALVFGGTVLLWAMGPGVVLLFLHERYRRTKLLEHAREHDPPA